MRPYEPSLHRQQKSLIRSIACMKVYEFGNYLAKEIGKRINKKIKT